MLTFRVGAAGAPSGGTAMARHLLEQTLPQDKADLAAYYSRTMLPAFAGDVGQDTFAGEAARLVRESVTVEDMPAALAQAVVDRHQAFVENYLDSAGMTAAEPQAFARLAEYAVALDDPVGELEDMGRTMTAGLERYINVREALLTHGRTAPLGQEEMERLTTQVLRDMRTLNGLGDRSDPDTQDLADDLEDRVAAAKRRLGAGLTTSLSKEEAAAVRGEIAAAERAREGILKRLDEALAAASYRHDKAVENMLAGREGRTIAEPRRDMHPALAARLGLDPHRAPTEAEIAHLLNGRRADGEAIEGRRNKRATIGLDVALGVTPSRLPTADEVRHMLDGRRAGGGVVEGDEADTARARFLRAVGVSGGEPTPDQARNLLAGRMADGSEVRLDAYEAAMTASSTRTGYIDLTFSADKSLSVAWAFAPTEAERAILFQAHRDAVDATLGYVAQELGRARMGDGGKRGSEAGHVGWIGFDHYTARPTVEIGHTDGQGRPYTELVTMRAAGDMQLHTHTALLNVVLTDGGRVASMDLDTIAGRVKEWGGLYQAHVATNLRRHGVNVVLDRETGAARLADVPATVRDAFSKRTRDGTEAARDYAKEQGLDWDALSPARRSGLLKEGTQKHKLAKQDGLPEQARMQFANDKRSDDLGDFDAWKRQADALGYVHRSVLRPDGIVAPLSRDERLELAREASLGLVDDLLQRKAKVDAQELRVLATRGLVASGVDTAADIDAITRSYRERGVRQDGRDTDLSWGYEPPVRGKARVGVTTALHESQERELIRLARAAGSDRAGALGLAAIQAAVKQREAMPVEAGGLRFGTEHGQAQRAVMDALGTSGRFAVAIGAAGSGKSALLAPLVDAWRGEGRRVYGAALAWRQSDDLAAAGIADKDRAALAAFVKRVERGAVRPDRNSVVVLDEVGLVGTRQMLTLLQLQRQHGFQIVAVGDPKQCAAIEAGPVIDLLRMALGSERVPELLTTVRQQTERERETASLFRDGNAEAALARKREDSTALLVGGGYQDAVQRTAALWRERVEAQGVSTDHTPGSPAVTVSAPTNADARAVGAAIREQRRAMGELGGDRVRLPATDQNGATYELPLAAGDRVRLFDRTRAHFPDRGTHGNIGNNGSVLTVTDIRADGLTLRTAAGREGQVAWSALRDRESGRIRLTYGDVLSIDAVQGVTSAEHISAMPGGTASVLGFKAYVAESRHRERSWLVVSDGAERREVSARRALNDSRPIRETDVWANMARNLSRQPEKPSALAFLAQATHVRRGAVRMMQAGMQRMETGAAEGRQAAPLRNRTARDLLAAVVKHQRVARFRQGLAQAGERMREVAAQVKPVVERELGRGARM